MAGQASLMEQGLDRVRSAVGSLDNEVERIRKNVRSRTRELERQLEQRRRRLEKRVEQNRKHFEKRARKRVDRVLTELRKQPAFRRAEQLRKDAGKRVEQGVETLWSALNLASKSDLQRIDRKLGQLRRKLAEIEKAQHGGRRHPAPVEHS